MAKKRLSNDTEIFTKLLANELTTPNEFTIAMGELIRLAREEKGKSQSDLAKELNRRQATISDIENGKSEIGVLTLIQFALVLEKPISYFFPKSLLKDRVVDVRTTFESKMLELARLIEYTGGNTRLTLDVIGKLAEHFEEEFNNPDGYQYEQYIENEDDDE